jgi:hypothetical protein
MLKGTIVYINGALGNKATIAKALATSDATSAQTYGVVQTDISNNSNGYVVVVGEVTGLDTSALTEGTQLYLSGTTAGYYTPTKPYAPTHLVYVAIVLRSHPTQGILGVKIQNGYEMDELHNVDAVSPSNNDGLFYNTSTSLWEHKPISTVLGYTPVTSARTISTTSPLSGGGDLSANRTLTIAQSNTTTSGYLSNTDWNTFNSKQDTITLTTTGTNGAATLVGSTLNIPQYSGTNIYNADGTLTGSRAVTMAAYNLSFTSTARTTGAAFSITATQTQRNASDTNDAALSASYTYASTNTSNQQLSRALYLSAFQNSTSSLINNLRVLDIQLSSNSSTTITDSSCIYIAANSGGLGTITTNRGVYINGMSGDIRVGLNVNSIGGSSSTYLLIGTNSITGGTWGIYQTESTFNNYFNGKILIGTTTDAGYNLDINGSARIQGNVVYECFQPTTTSVTSTATLTPDLSLGDTFTITAQAAALIIANPSGTPVNGQKMLIRIKDNGTARAITYGSQYRASTDLLLPSTTIVSKTLYYGFIYNSTDTKWDLIALLNNF